MPPCSTPDFGRSHWPPEIEPIHSQLSGRRCDREPEKRLPGAVIRRGAAQAARVSAPIEWRKSLANRRAALSERIHPFFRVDLWLAAAFAFLAEWIDPGQGMAKIGYAVVAVIVVSGFSPFGRNSGSNEPWPRCARCSLNRSKCCARVKRSRLLADQLVPGDIVLLEEGNNIPADCRLVEAFGVRVNNATVTGNRYPNCEPRNHPKRRK